jgi:hypothetical protein
MTDYVVSLLLSFHLTGTEKQTLLLRYQHITSPQCFIVKVQEEEEEE